MSHVLVAVFCQLCFLRGEQPSLKGVEPDGVAGDCCQTRLEYEAEQMIWILTQYAVCLRLRERQCARHLADPPHIVALVGVEWSEHLVGGESHRGEKQDAIDFPLTRQQHHPIVEPVSALLGRKT